MMSSKEIEEAILLLPLEERKKLISSFIPQIRSATTQESAEIRQVVDSTPDEEWVDWTDLKTELGH